MRTGRDTEKDQLLRDMEDELRITLEDDEYEAIRKVPTADMFLLQRVLNRVFRAGVEAGAAREA